MNLQRLALDVTDQFFAQSVGLSQYATFCYCRQTLWMYSICSDSQDADTEHIQQLRTILMQK